MRSLRACIAQIRIEDGKREENLRRVFEVLNEAVKRDCDLVVFPECILGGFANTKDVAMLLEDFVELFKDYPLAIAGSFAERDGDRIYDTAFLIDGNRVHTYRKTILFTPGGEHKIFAPGLSLPKVFDFRGWKVSMIICYELRFPELLLKPLKEGMELLIVPAARMAPRRVSDWEALIPARAVETQSYVIAVNRVGGKFFGRSAIAGPSGEVYRAGWNESLYVAEIDRCRIMETRSKIPAASMRSKLFWLKVERDELLKDMAGERSKRFFDKNKRRGGCFD